MGKKKRIRRRPKQQPVQNQKLPPDRIVELVIQAVMAIASIVAAVTSILKS